MRSRSSSSDVLYDMDDYNDGMWCDVKVIHVDYCSLVASSSRLYIIAVFINFVFFFCFLLGCIELLSVLKADGEIRVIKQPN